MPHIFNRSAREDQMRAGDSRAHKRSGNLLPVEDVWLAGGAQKRADEADRDFVLGGVLAEAEEEDSVSLDWEALGLTWRWLCPA
ncbi:hypothetical protein DXG03_009251 [Asterophora parasitica]|uniref:Uncharacterized protein n=1 Tax=Asterophora parasitica TaxID=117018 RepID=A0A9P7G4G4_9AGAR|nr:hypothetical protein DXG03_009251 [Asterophora parasitica]